MGWDGYGYGFRPYVSVGERRRKGEQAAKKMLAKGARLSPVKIEGRAIATTFWGKAWCDNLEAYGDYENRIPRGRAYARNGSVIDLQIGPGKIDALVQGSDLYTIKIEIGRLAPARWKTFKANTSGSVTNLLDLMQGKLPHATLSAICARDGGLFPAPREIKFACSCPDSASMCKHIAAALYGVGARLDTNPELFFTLRGLDAAELIAVTAQDVVGVGAGKARATRGLAESDLSAIFGVEIESETKPARRPGANLGKKPASKPAKAPAGKLGKAPAAKPGKAPAAKLGKAPAAKKAIKR